MQITPELLPKIIDAVENIIAENAEQVTALDQEIGDGDHVYNLQRGIEALKKLSDEFGAMDWSAAWQKIGMTLMSSVGGASGSLYGTFFITMSKAAKDQAVDFKTFVYAYGEGVESIKKRGKADVGEKTLLDVLVPVAQYLQRVEKTAIEPSLLDEIDRVAADGVEATRGMLATKGRASFLGERTKGHIDAGAKTAQLMIAAVNSVLAAQF